MTTLTVYPDAHEETTSVDGEVYFQPGFPFDTWANAKTAAGNYADDTDDEDYFVGFYSSTITDKWEILRRSIFLFDTSTLPDTCAISSVIFSVYGTAKVNALSLANLALNVYSSAPASNTALVAGDYDGLGSTAYCDTPITYDNYSTTGYNDFTLNATGIAAISKTGITKFGLREVTYDVGGATPTHPESDLWFRLKGYFSDKGTTYRPKLVIAYASGEGAGVLAIVETMIQYFDAYGNLRGGELPLIIP